MDSTLRQKEFASAQNTTWDVIVVGGGITGASAFRDAVHRGLKVLLIEGKDFASGTSSRSGKLIHGGLRYLKYGHFGLVFESCRERFALARQIAPHLVHPVAMHMPFYKSSHTPRFLAFLGVLIYNLLSLFRSVGRFALLSHKKMAQVAPFLRMESGVGGLVFHDCKALDFRLVMDFLHDGQAAGGVALNYAPLQRMTFRQEGGGVCCEVQDALTGQVWHFEGLCLLNAGGSWADDICARAGLEARFGLRLSKGVHAFVPASRLPLAEGGWALESVRDSRSLYAIPWGDVVLLGTTDTPFRRANENLTATLEDLEYLLDTVNFYFPDIRLSPADVLSITAGVRPLIGSNTGAREEDLPRDWEIRVDPRGVVSVTGGKLTTCRAMAEKTVDEVLKTLGKSVQKTDRTLQPLTAAQPLNPDEVKKIEGFWSIESERILKTWGYHALSLTAHAEKVVDPQQKLGPDITYGELSWAVHFEGVCRPLDHLCRRTFLWCRKGREWPEHLPALTEALGQIMGWSPETQAQVLNEAMGEVQNLLSALQYIRPQTSAEAAGASLPPTVVRAGTQPSG